MKPILLALCLTALVLSGCSSGPCDYPDDRARDGSRCGNRAASVRPGGREPQTDWIWWALIIGGAGYFIITNSGSSRSSGSSYTPTGSPRQATPKYESPQRKPLRPETQKVMDEIATGVKEAVNDTPIAEHPTSIDAKKVVAILRMAFDHRVDPNLQPIFEGVVSQTEKMGGTPFDAAARFIMAEVGSLDGMPGENIRAFVDHKTRCLYKNIHRITLNKETWPLGIMAVRKIWNLPDIEF